MNPDLEKLYHRSQLIDQEQKPFDESGEVVQRGDPLERSDLGAEAYG